MRRPRVTALLYLLLLITTASVPTHFTLLADDCPRCTQNVDPDAGGDDGGSCPTATDYTTCMSRCDCKFSQAVARCGSNNTACVEQALSSRNSCYEYCGKNFDTP